MSDKPIIVIKLGSNALVDDNGQLDVSFLHTVSHEVRCLVDAGWWPLIVSSGAVSCGLAAMGLHEKPSALPDRQALAAIGQSGLAHQWQAALTANGLQGAQLLLTGDDFQERSRYVNLAGALRSLAAYGVVPVINENDTVSVDELTVGDNDRLSAMVASQMNAERLLLLTDIEGVFDLDPRKYPEAQLLTQIKRIDESLLDRMGGEGLRGRGGMRSKLLAAHLAARAGVATTITKARIDRVITRVANGEQLGTLVPAQGGSKPNPRRRWLALARKTNGVITIDSGAVTAMIERGNSLLAAGVLDVSGRFDPGDTLSICDTNGREVGRGLAALNDKEMLAIRGLHMDDGSKALGYPIPKAVVHRDNFLPNQDELQT